MKMKFYSALLALSLGSAVAMADVNVTPSAPMERQKINCFGKLFGNASEWSHDFKIALIIDWAGDKGQSEIVVLRKTQAGYRILRQSSLAIETVQTSFQEIIRAVNPSSDNDLIITWRSDLGDDVPVRHLLKLGGTSYPIQFCKAVPNESPRF